MKTKNYWLRGGIIGIVIGVILSIYQSNQNWCIGSYMNPDRSIGSVCPPVSILTNMKILIVPELIAIVVLFIIGCATGWIIGKIIRKPDTVR